MPIPPDPRLEQLKHAPLLKILQSQPTHINKGSINPFQTENWVIPKIERYLDKEGNEITLINTVNALLDDAVKNEVAQITPPIIEVFISYMRLNQSVTQGAMGNYQGKQFFDPIGSTLDPKFAIFNLVLICKSNPPPKFANYADYLIKAVNDTQPSPASVLGALILLDRLLLKHQNFWLTELNIHKLFFIALVVAIKFMEDQKIHNYDYAAAGGLISSQQYNILVDFTKLNRAAKENPTNENLQAKLKQLKESIEQDTNHPNQLNSFIAFNKFHKLQQTFLELLDYEVAILPEVFQQYAQLLQHINHNNYTKNISCCGKPVV